MSEPPEHHEPAPMGSLLMRRMLHETEHARATAATDAKELREQRERLRNTRIERESDARRRVHDFSPRDLGAALRREIEGAFGADHPTPAPQPSPPTLAAARAEWATLTANLEHDVPTAIAVRMGWARKTFKRKRSMPMLPPALWQAVIRASEIHAALPDLGERYIAEQLEDLAPLDAELGAEVARRDATLQALFEQARGAVADANERAGLGGASWADPRWAGAAPATRMERIVRLGEFAPRLPQSAGVDPLPVLLDLPLSAGVAIAADVNHRPAAVDLARSLVLRILAATPPGDVRFVFVDPVSLGRSVADLRHLAEFDPRLVDTKTWTSERDIEARLTNLSDHLELVISNYLRGQFETIDEYNRHAGEVAEPYRVLVVFDYPAGFTARATEQLLSLIENGTRCGVHVILVHDPAAGAAHGELPLSRLLHSMQRVDLTRARGVTLPEPIGAVDLDFAPDPCPPVSFDPDGRPTSALGRLLLDVGAGARHTETGPVTLERVIPIIRKHVAAGRSTQLPELAPGAPDLDATDASTWWTATTAGGAYAPIGRAGAQDVAAMYFSSTEIAGGAIIVGLPRSGKSTALHAAITSMSMLYGPDELELYLIDSKHGVEFKIYERLPHARLVSTHSEREFSVSVLQSLDGEIARRAELMKSRSAGKANITEYRNVTGEPLARIVLFMDEFHEVFEEDDALGQQAFAAFSNIVRQGPFAGVHVVVASQTLSSMPAMDRGTLSLLPMRVAFTCNEADADLVMGDANREVKALHQQGEGIFNPARGEPSRNKPFRGIYLTPDVRDATLDALCAKAVANGQTRTPRVFDGDTFARRNGGAPPASPQRPVFALGEPFGLDPTVSIALRRGRGANVLLLGVGDDEDQRDGAVEAVVHSCLADGAGLSIAVVDFIGDVGGEDGRLDLLTLCGGLGVRYHRGSALGTAVSELRTEVDTRRAAGDYTRQGRLLILHGIHRALDLAPDDSYDDEGLDEREQTARDLAAVVRDGPEVGCHTIISVDRVAQFERRLGRDALKEFDWRIAGAGLGSSDISAVTESFGDLEIRPSQLLIVDHGRGRSRRIRAYPRLTADDLPPPTDRTPT